MTESRGSVDQHVFVDETKAKGYLLVAAVVGSAELGASRRAIKSLFLPGQSRLHFTSERSARRNQILDALMKLSVTAVIFDASGYRNPARARDACLVSLVGYLGEIRARRLVLERDDAAQHSDNVILYRSIRKAGLAEHLRYYHLRAHDECLLAIPDALAWCWARGGRWRTKAEKLVVNVRTA